MQSQTARLALITGANKGIGFEIARQLGKAGHRVLLGARNESLGEAAASDSRPRVSRFALSTSTSAIRQR
jgi:NAD(P)-dependent dehydrogenase (short-subunit alcohol dehydrogenase family)